MTQAAHLLSEPPMLVYPSLARILGINKAIMFQQLHFLLNMTKTSRNTHNFLDGRWWVYNSYPQWREEHFVWLSESSIKNLFNELEKEGLILSRQGIKNPTDRRKWYSINYDTWDKYCLSIGQKMSDLPSDKNCLMNGQKLSDDISEITTEKKKKEPNHASRNLVFDAVAQYVWGITDPETLNEMQKSQRAATRIGMVTAWLQQKTDRITKGKKVLEIGFITSPAQPAHVKAFARWWRENKTGIEIPRDVETFIERWREFGSEQKKKVHINGAKPKDWGAHEHTWYLDEGSQA